MKKIKINTETINLDQFLKWANIVSSGGEAKFLIKKGKVVVNSEIEKRRGTNLSPGDIVEIEDQKYKIIT
jgi:ribosome-associated protein